MTISTADDVEPVICEFCNGSGEGQHDGTTCWRCHGQGEVYPGPARDDRDYEQEMDDRREAGR